MHKVWSNSSKCSCTKRERKVLFSGTLGDAEGREEGGVSSSSRWLFKVLSSCVVHILLLPWLCSVWETVSHDLHDQVCVHRTLCVEGSSPKQGRSLRGYKRKRCLRRATEAKFANVMRVERISSGCQKSVDVWFGSELASLRSGERFDSFF